MRSALDTHAIRVSVVVTCYDLGRYLIEALDSVDASPLRGQCEVIVVDDGSSDPGTVAVLDGLDVTRYHVIRQSNTGLGKARNNGIRVANGEYIIPLDADNRLRPAMIEEAIRVLDERPDVGVVYGDAEYFGERSGRWHVGPFDLGSMLIKNRIDACAAFRKSLWEKVGGYDEHMPAMGYEDWDFWLRSTVAGAEFHYVPQILFDYRVRGGSMLGGTMKSREMLVEYIFGKPQLRFLAPLRNRHIGLMEQVAARPVLTGRDLLRMLYERIVERSLRPFRKDRADGR